MPMVAVFVVVAKYATVIAGIYEVVDIGQVIAGHNAITLPHFISDGAVTALAGNRKRFIDYFYFRHGLPYHACIVLAIVIIHVEVAPAEFFR